ncbi:MAG TPA: DUF5941 domain-containing protein [Solirubrobacteraceae bacterium]|jgi:hypothetical protein
MTPGPLQIYRDDGPLARAIGRLVAAPEAIVAVLGAAVLGVVLGLSDDATPAGLLIGGVALAVVIVATGAGRPHDGAFSWLVPPVLRALEYAGLIRLTSLADPDAMPICFALLAVLAFHHYDIVYRLRQQGAAPPAWTRTVGGGWEGRLLVAAVLAAFDVLGTGMLVAAIALTCVWVGESVASWTSYARALRPAVIDDEEAEDE